MNGQLRAVDFAPGRFSPAQPAQPGLPGPRACREPPASPVWRSSLPERDDSASHHQVDVTCPAGKRVVGGGAQVYDANAEAALDESLPVDADTWRATAYEVNATGRTGMSSPSQSAQSPRSTANRRQISATCAPLRRGASA